MSSLAVSYVPILYSFRRCPYAMRARMALGVANVEYEIREVSLRAKPSAMLAVSPKGTVPVLVLPDGQVLDESLDIMRWALAQHDPNHWLAHGAEMDELIAANDGSFKFHLDRAKYSNRYAGSNPAEHREAALNLLQPLERRLRAQNYLFGATPSLADVAIFPFVRQFARAAPEAFAAAQLPALTSWLVRWECAALFQSVMTKHPVWASAESGS